MKKNLHKNLVFLMFLNFFGIFSVPTTFANMCAIEGGPIPEMTQYAQQINAELSEILSQSSKKECGIMQNAYSIFEAARADISAMEYTFTDFRYNMNSVTNGGTNIFVKRDEKFFDTIEKRIEKTIDQLANSCQLNRENREQLRAMIVETQTLRNAYRRAALGSPLVQSTGIREKNVELVEKISSAYSPSAISACVPNTNAQKWFFQTLKNAINIGGKMDESLKTWRKALDMFRGGGNTMSVSEVSRLERSLLQAELSRQWLSNTAKNVILKNFDCYKARTLDNSNAENVLEARFSCLQMPITGLEKVFNIGDNAKSIYNNAKTTWNDFVWQSNNSNDFIKRREIAISRQNRAINIEEMYQKLNLLSSTDADINDSTKKGLIDLHISLLETNTLLEERIPDMQNNCMQWQPGIVGGCR